MICDGQSFNWRNIPSPTEANQGTSAEDINPAGMIAGYHEDTGNVFHGFLTPRFSSIGR
jgi:hypothetical protein